MKKSATLKITILLIILACLIFVVQLPSLAAGSFTAKAGKDNMTVGENTTLTVTANSCGGKFTITSSDSSVVSISGDTTPWIENRKSFSYSCRK